LQQARTRVADLHRDIAKLQADNARLRAEIDSVKKSTYAVERIAREDLGMSRKGEIVYTLPANRSKRCLLRRARRAIERARVIVQHLRQNHDLLIGVAP